MASILNFSNFTFTTEQIRSLKELLYDEVIKSPEYNRLYTTYPNIVFDKEVGFIGKGSLAGVPAQGCDPTPQQYNIGTRKITWKPKEWEVFIGECKTTLESTAAVYSLKTGIAAYDFTESDYMAIVLEVLMDSIRDFFTRIAWFAEEGAKNFANNGNITNGVDVKYFSLINGFFHQMEEEITSSPSQYVAIAENKAATYAAQALDPKNVQAYLEKLVYNAPIQLRSRENKFILCTQSFYDAYQKSLAGGVIESMYRNLVDGQKTLTYNGIELIAIPKWDEIIASYYNNGTKLVNPHRAVFTSKDFLAIGVDSENSLGEIDVWYEKKDRNVYMQAGGKLDAKLSHPKMFVLAQ